MVEYNSTIRNAVPQTPGLNSASEVIAELAANNGEPPSPYVLTVGRLSCLVAGQYPDLSSADVAKTLLALITLDDEIHSGKTTVADYENPGDFMAVATIAGTVEAAVDSASQVFSRPSGEER